MSLPGQVWFVIIDWVYTTFGPFLIPVAVFAAGLVGYGLLVALYRRGILGNGPLSTDGDGRDRPGDDRPRDAQSPDRPDRE
jgi:hypothetical protein